MVDPGMNTPLRYRCSSVVFPTAAAPPMTILTHGHFMPNEFGESLGGEALGLQVGDPL
jgi:hypothetical protein